MKQSYRVAELQDAVAVFARTLHSLSVGGMMTGSFEPHLFNIGYNLYKGAFI